MTVKPIHAWQHAPFLRLLIPFIAGIIIQWYFKIPPRSLGLLLFAGFIIASSFYYFKPVIQFQFQWITGIAIHLILFSTGGLLLNNKMIDPGFNYLEHNVIQLTLQEPLSDKPNSYKAIATVNYVIQVDTAIYSQAKVILYFKKDSISKRLTYGSQIIISKPLQPISNTGNPGAFDYKRYCYFQDIFYQVYLGEDDFKVLATKNISPLKRWLFNSREKVVTIIRRYIKSVREAGLAEALLIGYKDDLDKNLVQSYSNTGVVHVVAISGLHLGLIYWLLSAILKPLDRKKNLHWLQVFLIITGLWLFSLLAGGGPSVIRSAVMFSFIVLGKGFSKKTAILNSLAASAFLLLCYNPYWLWDVGFQLSYAAVLSLVLFMQPIYQLFFVQNKMLDFIWQLNAVTLAAQVLTIPMCVYYFHQFPTLFLITNMVAVPLSSLIVLGEIALCLFSFFPAMANLAGIVLEKLISWMNQFILYVDKYPFALWKGLQISLLQAIIMYALIVALSIWLMQKRTKALLLALTLLLAFIALRSFSFLQTSHQQMLLLYNVPKHTAMDFIEGEHFVFEGDEEIKNDNAAGNFYFSAARNLYRIKATESLSGLVEGNHIFLLGTKKILLVDRLFNWDQFQGKLDADLIILAGNPGIKPDLFFQKFTSRQLVAMGSVSRWGLSAWQEACRKANIPFYSVADSGAYTVKINQLILWGYSGF